MATQKLIPAPTCADTAGTAPLNPAAAEALAKLEQAFAPERAAQDYRKAAERVRQLSDLAEFDRLSDLDARSLAEAEADMGAAHTTLAAAGRLDLIGGAS
ncbi:hypothetical protein ACI3K5_23790 [Streptomyces sp. MPA0124]|uniref:hypothetical protein n=1 Tax=Streptomyces sp. MPA0124 TaxID=3378069 RepID=UPI0038527532